jgi:hypothetical protein
MTLSKTESGWLLPTFHCVARFARVSLPPSARGFGARNNETPHCVRSLAPCSRLPLVAVHIFGTLRFAQSLAPDTTN